MLCWKCINSYSVLYLLSLRQTSHLAKFWETVRVPHFSPKVMEAVSAWLSLCRNCMQGLAHGKKPTAVLQHQTNGNNYLLFSFCGAFSSTRSFQLEFCLLILKQQLRSNMWILIDHSFKSKLEEIHKMVSRQRIIKSNGKMHAFKLQVLFLCCHTPV